MVRISNGPLGHPFLVIPDIVEIMDHRGLFRRDLIVKRERIRFVGPVSAMARSDMILVGNSLLHLGDEPLPDPGSVPGTKEMYLLVPTVEISDHRDPFGIRGPNGKIRSLHTILLHKMGSQLLVEAEMASLVEQEKIVGGDKR
jgi:hypothetical protein